MAITMPGGVIGVIFYGCFLVFQGFHTPQLIFHLRRIPDKENHIACLTLYSIVSFFRSWNHNFSILDNIEKIQEKFK